MSLLSVKDFNIAFGTKQILRNVSFDIDPGEIVAITGESGSGKSMTAMGIMGLLPPRARSGGTVQLLDEMLTDMPERQLCQLRGNRMGMVFQEPMTALNPVKTIGEQVSEHIYLHRPGQDAEAIAARLLQRVGLPAETFPPTRYPHELSGGQRQRVVIAIAIACGPRLLIADEPTTALDVTTQAQILQLLTRLAREDGLGLLMITHDLAVVANMADRLLVMKEGEIVESGPTRRVFGEMKHPYTRSLFKATAHRVSLPEADTGQSVLLKAEGVTRIYRSRRMRVRAVNDVSFEIRTGERVGLVGESGCGKSTLTRAILGLERLQRGRITLDGKPVRNSRAARQMMQVVFQDPYGSFNPRHTVGRLIREPFYGHANAPSGRSLDKLVFETLEAVGLNETDAERYPHQFSGGQRQRIAIARALITRPKLVIFDEAVSALDVSIRARILDLIAELCTAYALTYIFVSHDLSVVRSVTDRVMVMQKGCVVEEGPTEQVFTQPQNAYTRTLIEAAPKLPPFLLTERVDED